MSQQAAERHDHPPAADPLGGDACCGGGGADGSVGRLHLSLRIQGAGAGLRGRCHGSRAGDQLGMTAKIGDLFGTAVQYDTW